MLHIKEDLRTLGKLYNVQIHKIAQPLLRKSEQICATSIEEKLVDLRSLYYGKLSRL